MAINDLTKRLAETTDLSPMYLQLARTPEDSAAVTESVLSRFESGAPSPRLLGAAESKLREKYPDYDQKLTLLQQNFPDMDPAEARGMWAAKKLKDWRDEPEAGVAAANPTIPVGPMKPLPPGGQWEGPDPYAAAEQRATPASDEMPWPLREAENKIEATSGWSRIKNIVPEMGRRFKEGLTANSAADYVGAAYNELQSFRTQRDEIQKKFSTETNPTKKAMARKRLEVAESGVAARRMKVKQAEAAAEASAPSPERQLVVAALQDLAVGQGSFAKALENITDHADAFMGMVAENLPMMASGIGTLPEIAGRILMPQVGQKKTTPLEDVRRSSMFQQEMGRVTQEIRSAAGDVPISEDIIADAAENYALASAGTEVGSDLVLGAIMGGGGKVAMKTGPGRLVKKVLTEKLVKPFQKRIFFKLLGTSAEMLASAGIEGTQELGQNVLYAASVLNAIKNEAAKKRAAGDEDGANDLMEKGNKYIQAQTFSSKMKAFIGGSFIGFGTMGAAKAVSGAAKFAAKDNAPAVRKANQEIAHREAGVQIGGVMNEGQIKAAQRRAREDAAAASFKESGDQSYAPIEVGAEPNPVAEDIAGAPTQQAGPKTPKQHRAEQVKALVAEIKAHGQAARSAAKEAQKTQTAPIPAAAEKPASQPAGQPEAKPAAPAPQAPASPAPVAEVKRATPPKKKVAEPAAAPSAPKKQRLEITPDLTPAQREAYEAYNATIPAETAAAPKPAAKPAPVSQPAEVAPAPATQNSPPMTAEAATPAAPTPPPAPAPAPTEVAKSAGIAKPTPTAAAVTSAPQVVPKYATVFYGPDKRPATVVRHSKDGSIIVSDHETHAEVPIDANDRVVYNPTDHSEEYLAENSPIEVSHDHADENMRPKPGDVLARPDGSRVEVLDNDADGKPIIIPQGPKSTTADRVTIPAGEKMRAIQRNLANFPDGTKVISSQKKDVAPLIKMSDAKGKPILINPADGEKIHQRAVKYYPVADLQQTEAQKKGAVAPAPAATPAPVIPAAPLAPAAPVVPTKNLADEIHRSLGMIEWSGMSMENVSNQLFGAFQEELGIPAARRIFLDKESFIDIHDAIDKELKNKTSPPSAPPAAPSVAPAATPAPVIPAASPALTPEEQKMAEKEADMGWTGLEQAKERAAVASPAIMDVPKNRAHWENSLLMENQINLEKVSEKDRQKLNRLLDGLSSIDAKQKGIPSQQRDARRKILVDTAIQLGIDISGIKDARGKYMLSRATLDIWNEKLKSQHISEGTYVPRATQAEKETARRDVVTKLTSRPQSVLAPTTSPTSANETTWESKAGPVTIGDIIMHADGTEYVIKGADPKGNPVLRKWKSKVKKEVGSNTIAYGGLKNYAKTSIAPVETAAVAPAAKPVPAAPKPAAAPDLAAQEKKLASAISSGIDDYIAREGKDPEEKPGLVRFYRGESSEPGARMAPEDQNEMTGKFWSTAYSEAESYGDRIWYIDVPKNSVSMSGGSSIFSSPKSALEMGAKLFEPGYFDLGADLYDATEGKDWQKAKALRNPTATAPAPIAQVAKPETPPSPQAQAAPLKAEPLPAAEPTQEEIDQQEAEAEDGFVETESSPTIQAKPGAVVTTGEKVKMVVKAMQKRLTDFPNGSIVYHAITGRPYMVVSKETAVPTSMGKRDYTYEELLDAKGQPTGKWAVYSGRRKKTAAAGERVVPGQPFKTERKSVKIFDGPDAAKNRADAQALAEKINASNESKGANQEVFTKSRSVFPVELKGFQYAKGLARDAFVGASDWAGRILPAGIDEEIKTAISKATGGKDVHPFGFFQPDDEVTDVLTGIAYSIGERDGDRVLVAGRTADKRGQTVNAPLNSPRFMLTDTWNDMLHADKVGIQKAAEQVYAPHPIMREAEGKIPGPGMLDAAMDQAYRERAGITPEESGKTLETISLDDMEPGRFTYPGTNEVFVKHEDGSTTYENGAGINIDPFDQVVDLSDALSGPVSAAGEEKLTGAGTESAAIPAPTQRQRDAAKVVADKLSKPISEFAEKPNPDTRVYHPKAGKMLRFVASNPNTGMNTFTDDAGTIYRLANDFKLMPSDQVDAYNSQVGPAMQINTAPKAYSSERQAGTIAVGSKVSIPVNDKTDMAGKIGIVSGSSGNTITLTMMDGKKKSFNKYAPLNVIDDAGLLNSIDESEEKSHRRDVAAQEIAKQLMEKAEEEKRTGKLDMGAITPEQREIENLINYPEHVETVTKKMSEDEKRAFKNALEEIERFERKGMTKEEALDLESELEEIRKDATLTPVQKLKEIQAAKEAISVLPKKEVDEMRRFVVKAFKGVMKNNPSAVSVWLNQVRQAAKSVQGNSERGFVTMDMLLRSPQIAWLAAKELRKIIYADRGQKWNTLVPIPFVRMIDALARKIARSFFKTVKAIPGAAKNWRTLGFPATVTLADQYKRRGLKVPDAVRHVQKAREDSEQRARDKYRFEWQKFKNQVGRALVSVDFQFKEFEKEFPDLLTWLTLSHGGSGAIQSVTDERIGAVHQILGPEDSKTLSEFLNCKNFLDASPAWKNSESKKVIAAALEKVKAEDKEAWLALRSLEERQKELMKSLHFKGQVIKEGKKEIEIDEQKSRDYLEAANFVDPSFTPVEDPDFGTIRNDLMWRLARASSLIWETSRDMLTRAYGHGLIGRFTYDYLLENHRFYTPRILIKLIDPDARAQEVGNFSSPHSLSNSGIQSLSGGSSEALTYNWELQMASMISRTIRRTFQQEANIPLAKMVKDIKENPDKFAEWKDLGFDLIYPEKNEANESGDFTYPPLPKDKDVGRVYFYDEYEPGKTRRVGIQMPMSYYESWKLYDPVMSDVARGVLRQVMLVPLFKALATGINPVWGVQNVPADIQMTMYRQMMRKGFFRQMLWFVPDLLTTTGNLFSGVASSLNNDADSRTFSQSGGDQALLSYSTRYHYDPRGTFNRFGPVRAASKLFSGLGDFAGAVGYHTEKGNRIGAMRWWKDKLYAENIAKGMDEQEAMLKATRDAALNARQIIDYSNVTGTVRAFETFIPYVSASVAGLKAFGSSIRKDPGAMLGQLIWWTAINTYLQHQFLVAAAKVPDWIEKYWDEEQSKNYFIIPITKAFKDRYGKWMFPVLRIKVNVENRIARAMSVELENRVVKREGKSALASSILNVLNPLYGANVPLLGVADALTSGKERRGLMDVRDINGWMDPKLAPRARGSGNAPPLFKKTAAHLPESVLGLRTPFAQGGALQHAKNPDALAVAYDQAIPGNFLPQVAGMVMEEMFSVDEQSGKDPEWEKYLATLPVLEKMTTTPGVKSLFHVFREPASRGEQEADLVAREEVSGTPSSYERKLDPMLPETSAFNRAVNKVRSARNALIMSTGGTTVNRGLREQREALSKDESKFITNVQENYNVHLKRLEDFKVQVEKKKALGREAPDAGPVIDAYIDQYLKLSEMNMDVADAFSNKVDKEMERNSIAELGLDYADYRAMLTEFWNAVPDEFKKSGVDPAGVVEEEEIQPSE